ncbi:Isoflavone reductase-like protein [Cardamine amara subsp. amara]|uniref:Isoflavone reductase-like protein n=1 Tax=Cardamine amara subsp. amara TaxID=228776 RepID=A0ABD0Z3X1_CARAN
MAMNLSKVLVIGGTGYIGKYIVQGSAKSGHQTFALMREASLSDPVKGKIVQSFKDLGVTILNGDLSDKESLVKAIQHVDVVISTVGNSQILNQINIISAIKESGKHIKRFLPSEFGNDVDRTVAIGPAKTEFELKAEIRRVVEAEGVPYTYVINNCFDGYFLATLAQCESRLTSPPRDKVTIYGDGNTKAILNKEEDIAAYTMRAIDDPRTLNKTFFINPPKNIVSQNEIVALWESKIGKTLEKTYVSEEELLKKIPESPHPLDLLFALNHAIFVKGDQTCFTIDPSSGVEASQLFPDVKYTSVDEYLSQFV